MVCGQVLKAAGSPRPQHRLAPPILLLLSPVIPLLPSRSLRPTLPSPPLQVSLVLLTPLYSHPGAPSPIRRAQCCMTLSPATQPILLTKLTLVVNLTISRTIILVLILLLIILWGLRALLVVVTLHLFMGRIVGTKSRGGIQLGLRTF